MGIERIYAQGGGWCCIKQSEKTPFCHKYAMIRLWGMFGVEKEGYSSMSTLANALPASTREAS